MKKDIIGTYQAFNDLVSLAVDHKAREKRTEAVAVLIHEFGHRLWTKFLPKKAKAEYVRAFGWLSKDDLVAMWNAVMVADFVLCDAVQLVAPRLQKELQLRFRSALQNTARRYEITVKEVREQAAAGEKAIYGEGVRGNIKYHMLKSTKPKVKVPVSSVSYYGKTSAEEDFCETFMFYCMDWDISEASADRLVNALSQAKQ